MFQIQMLKDWINSMRLNIQSKKRKKLIHRSINSSDVSHLLPTVKIKKEWYGNSYGGFFLNPDLLNGQSIIYSFGIGKDLSFDNKILKKHHCKVFAFDPTPNSIEWVNRQKKNENMHIYPIGLSNTDGYTDFNIPSKKKRISGSLLPLKGEDYDVIKVQMNTLNSIMKKLNHEKIDLLKMDIEGAEYDTIPQILECKIYPKHFIVEFHDRMLGTSSKNSKDLVELMKLHGYAIFASSISFEEISFIHLKS